MNHLSHIWPDHFFLLAAEPVANISKLPGGGVQEARLEPVMGRGAQRCVVHLTKLLLEVVMSLKQVDSRHSPDIRIWAEVKKRFR